MIHLLILLFSLFHCGRALQTSPLATIPLFVRSPYLNCWGTFYYRDTLKIQTVAFSDTQQPRSGWDPSLDVLDLVVLVRVDKSTYLFIGDAPTVNATINFTNVVISPTQTKLTAEAGPMQFNLTFLNPIEPRDWINQSIPFSYMSLTARSLDGAAHATQIYSDLRIVWLQNPTQVFSGDTDSNPDIFYYSIYHGSEWSRSQSTLYFAAKLDGLDVVTINLATNGSVSRDLFRRNGVLDGEVYLGDHYTNLTISTVFAISRDLGTIQATQDPVIWAIGYDIDPVINYTDLSGAPPQQRRLFYKVQYDDGASILSDFISDFANASSRAQELDQKILQYGAPISGPLEYLVSFATAQVYGSFHLTTSIDANGYFNKSDVMALMRSSSGSRTYRVNAVETLYSAFPAFMCIDPELGGLFLESLFRPQASPKYTNPYAAADLGGDYPDVTFTNSAHNQGVEQSGNMLIMTYAHARASGDVSLIGRYYDLLTSWADYLSNATLLIHDQSSADGLSADNQTNLAIKGIIAVEAMSKMSSIVKQDADVDKYSNTAAGLYAQWKSLALTSDKHLFATYEQVGSWTLGYNLFADVWLNTSIVESSVYDGQSNFINSLLLALNYSVLGVPVDNLGSDTSVSVPGWGLFVAAMTPDQDIRTKLILSIEAAVINGVVLGFDPALGAMYAPLALKFVYGALFSRLRLTFLSEHPSS
ncbi:hypothetical protein H4582DRAFT_1214353 [Lactarius indigo]|nr:hypothetical protein H4582DRAFT_1214353 [Lactarius indigo]